MNKEFVSERLELLVRDIFVFSCFTGLAYIDVKQLTRNNISLGIDGDKWIFKNRQKTDTASKIPLDAIIPSNLISNAETVASEAALQTALDNLRSHSTLSGAMVTSYTYIPLVGSVPSPIQEETEFIILMTI